MSDSPLVRDIMGQNIEVISQTETDPSFTGGSAPSGGGSSGRGGGSGRTPECHDGIDNDHDKKKDYPQDPGCVSLSDASELDIKEVSRCGEKWVCTEWKPCKEGKQTRECDDINTCDTTFSQPILEQSCEEGKLGISLIEFTNEDVKRNMPYLIFALAGVLVFIIGFEIRKKRKK